MLAKTTLAAFTILLMGASLAGFVYSTAQTVASNTDPKPKPKLPPRIVFDIPNETLDTSRPPIERLSIYDPTPEQVQNKALLDAIKADVAKGHAARNDGNDTAALEHYYTAFSIHRDTLLDVKNYDVRFGLALVAPPIAETYVALNDDRAIPAAERIEAWQRCGLMASAKVPKLNFDPEKCGEILTFELFHATGD